MKKITAERIEDVASKLRQLPPTKRPLAYTMADALARLGPEIAALRERGYSLAQIAKTLRGEGLAVDVATLKASLSKVPPAPAPPAPAALAPARPVSAARKLAAKAPTSTVVPKKPLVRTPVAATRTDAKKVPPKRAPARASKGDDAAAKPRSSRAMFEIKPDTDDI